MDITKVLRAIRPGAAWTLNGDTYDGLTWLDKVQAKPTLAEIEAAWPAVKAALAAKAAVKTETVASLKAALIAKGVISQVDLDKAAEGSK